MKIRSIFIVKNSVFYTIKINSTHSTQSTDTMLGNPVMTVSGGKSRFSRSTFMLSGGMILLCLILLQSCQPVSTKKSASKTKSKNPSSSLTKSDSVLPNGKTLPKDEQDEKHSSKVALTSDSSELSAKRKIPTLREQMEKVQAQQSITNTKLDSLQMEVLSLKNDIAELKTKPISQPTSVPESQIKPRTTKTKKSTPSLKGESIQMEESANSNSKNQQDELFASDTKRSDTKSADKSKKSNSGLILPDNEGTASPNEMADKKKQSTKQNSDIILPDNEQENQSNKEAKKRPTIVREIKPDGMTEEDIVDDISSSKKLKSSSAKRTTTKNQSVRQMAKSQNMDAGVAEISKSSSKTSSEVPPPVKETPKEQPKESVVDAPNSTTANTTGSASYNTALALFAKKQYSEAINLLSEITSKEKSGATVANAYYWMAESYFGMGKYADAIKNFDKVLELKSPQKSDDALAGIAEAQAKNGNTTEAKKVYQRLLSQYPQSDYVAQARKRLQQL
jgi:TolA-binding protein